MKNAEKYAVAAQVISENAENPDVAPNTVVYARLLQAAGLFAIAGELGRCADVLEASLKREKSEGASA